MKDHTKYNKLMKYLTVQNRNLSMKDRHKLCAAFENKVFVIDYCRRRQRFIGNINAILSLTPEAIEWIKSVAFNIIITCFS